MVKVFSESPSALHSKWSSRLWVCILASPGLFSPKEVWLHLGVALKSYSGVCNSLNWSSKSQGLFLVGWETINQMREPALPEEASTWCPRRCTFCNYPSPPCWLEMGFLTPESSDVFTRGRIWWIDLIFLCGWGWGLALPIFLHVPWFHFSLWLCKILLCRQTCLSFPQLMGVYLVPYSCCDERCCYKHRYVKHFSPMCWRSPLGMCPRAAQLTCMVAACQFAEKLLYGFNNGYSSFHTYQQWIMGPLPRVFTIIYCCLFSRLWWDLWF